MYAAIDLGSNSFHLLIALIEGRHIGVVSRNSEKVQLGEGVSITGQLSPSAMDRGIACLERFQQSLAETTPSTLRIIGTNALRQATNADVFLERAAALGMNIEVITGEQEAELIYRGVCLSLKNANHSKLVFDIGGGSTEFISGNSATAQNLCSLTIGCVSWRDRFFAEDAIDQHAIETAAQETQAQVRQALSHFQQSTWQSAYASSGTAKLLAQISRDNDISEGEITLTGLNAIQRLAMKSQRVSKLDIKGLKVQRQSLLLPGLAIMKGIMQGAQLETVHYCKSALREGLIAQLADQ